MSEQVDEPRESAPEQFEIETVETLRRSYAVSAPDRDAAVARLRAFWKDPEAMKAGLVTRSASESVSSRQVREPGK